MLRRYTSTGDFGVAKQHGCRPWLQYVSRAFLPFFALKRWRLAVQTAVAVTLVAMLVLVGELRNKFPMGVWAPLTAAFVRYRPPSRPFVVFCSPLFCPSTVQRRHHRRQLHDKLAALERHGCRYKQSAMQNPPP